MSGDALEWVGATALGLALLLLPLAALLPARRARLSRVRDRPVRPPTRVFISSGAADRPARDALVAALTTGLGGRAVQVDHDREIPLGPEWDQGVRPELAQADLVIFLLSPAALRCPFCMKREVPAAREQGTLLPVLLRPCAWETAGFTGVVPARALWPPEATAPDLRPLLTILKETLVSLP